MTDKTETDRLADTLALADGTGFLVRVVSSRATALYERLTGQSEVTPQQFGVLLTLHQRGPLTLTDLAAAVHLDRSTLGEMTRRMTARGLLQRRDNAHDRRSTLVSNTEAGTAVLKRLVEGAAALQAELLAPLAAEDRRHFLSCLRRIALSHADAGPGAVDPEAGDDTARTMAMARIPG